MPPTSNIRKTSTSNPTLTHVNDLSAAPRRTTSGRAVRANTTRPTNYYARPFGSFGAASASNHHQDEAQEMAAPGFFPALQYFSDAIAALPKEVMRQFTLMKEVEAKIHGQNEKIGEMVDALMEYSVPPRKGAQTVDGDGSGLLSLTANNSVTGSATASLVNGVAPRLARDHSAPNSTGGSLNDDDAAPHESEESLAKRKAFLEFRMSLHNSLANLDEKNVVLAEANRVLGQQQSRIDSVMPHVESEVSEEARLGSKTHWAYSDNRQKKPAPGTAANRRDMAAANSLAAAASAIHETEIMQARRDAVRETTRDKHKGRAREYVDSDFDDKPKKTHLKIAKSKGATQAGATGLGVTNGEPTKKRKLDKGLAAPAMERSISQATKGSKASKDTPTSTPVLEQGKKTAAKAKQAPPLQKRKGVSSVHTTPVLASSPLHSSFNPATMEPPTNARPQSARLRQNSGVTNLRHEKLVVDEQISNRPTSSAGKMNGEKPSNGKRKVPGDGKEHGEPTEDIAKTTEMGDELKREDMDIAVDSDRPHMSRSDSNSGKAGRGSKNGTPRTENFPDAPAMVRARSTRSVHTNGRDEPSSEPQVAPSKHRRQPSNSHLVKQLAPFNRSPDLDRHRHDTMDHELDGMDGSVPERDEAASSRSPRKRPISRRNTGALVMEASSPPLPPTSPLKGQEDGGEGERKREQEQEQEQGQDVAMPDFHSPSPAPQPEPAVPDLEPEAVPDSHTPNQDTEVAAADSPVHLMRDVDHDEADEEADEEADDEPIDEDSEPGDPDDPNEPKYCYCNRGSYGEMVACDNEACTREWFHIDCTELKATPAVDVTWYCRECRPLFVPARKKGGRAGAGRGAGGGGGGFAK